MSLRNLVSIFGFAVIAAALAGGPALAAEQDGALSTFERPGEDPLLRDVTEITRQYPRAAVREFEKGMDDSRKGKLANAARHLEDAIRIAPQFFNAHNSLGALYQMMERYRDAEREYREAHRLNPRSAAPLVNLGALHIVESVSRGAGDALARRSLLNDALASLNSALELQPSSAVAHCLTGVVYYKTGFFEDAEFHLLRALDNGSRSRLARLALAGLYIHTQEWTNALLQLDAYLAENRFSSDRHWIRILRQELAEKVKGTNQ